MSVKLKFLPKTLRCELIGSREQKQKKGVKGLVLLLLLA